MNVDSRENLKEIAKDFDCFFVGSDQIWNPYVLHSSNVKFLKFAQREKCFSYSASFGLDGMPRFRFFAYLRGLKHLKKISVREESAAKIVKRLVGVDVPIVLDPTMLLTEQDWSDFAGEKPLIEGDYLCTYFLGRGKPHMAQVEKYAKKFHLKIVKLNDKSNEDLFCADPRAFVNIIKNSKLVCTDSFHGTVFSIIFEKPFVVFKRKDLNCRGGNRMITLFRKLQMQVEIGKIPENPLKIDFHLAKEKLEEERKKSFAFLSECLSGGVDAGN